MATVSSNRQGPPVIYASRKEWNDYWNRHGSAGERRHIAKHGEPATKGMRTEKPGAFADVIVISTNAVIVPKLGELVFGSAKAYRLEWGETLVHELAHTKGADEFDARVAGRAYLNKSGLQGPSDKQIFLDIYEGEYKKEVVQFAEKRAFGNSFGPIGRFFRALSIIHREGKYSVEVELQGTTGSNRELA